MKRKHSEIQINIEGPNLVVTMVWTVVMAHLEYLRSLYGIDVKAKYLEPKKKRKKK